MASVGLRLVLARLVRAGAGKAGRRFALVVQLDNPESLCASLGPALFDRMMDKLTLRLVEDLRLIRRPARPVSRKFAVSLSIPSASTWPIWRCDCRRYLPDRGRSAGNSCRPGGECGHRQRRQHTP